MTNPTLTEKDVAEIAAGLTKPLGDGLRLHKPGKARAWLLPTRGAHITWKDVGHELKRLGLVAFEADPRSCCTVLTPLGLAVRNHLISTPNMPKGDRADG